MNFIARYMNNLSRNDVNRIAIQNSIILRDNELDFVFNYLKNNYKELIKNKDSFNFDLYKEKFSEENFIKIKKLINKYINFL